MFLSNNSFNYAFRSKFIISKLLLMDYLTSYTLTYIIPCVKDYQL